MNRTPNRKIPIIILLVILVIGTLIVFFSMSDSQKKSLLNTFKSDPLDIVKETSIENNKTEEYNIDEVLANANESMKNTKYINCKLYKNEILHKNNFESWSLNKETNLYKYNDSMYIDLQNNVQYFKLNGKWYKKDNDVTVDTDTEKYTIPETATQIDDEKIDGADCFVFTCENKTYYIKKSTQTINYIKEVQDSDNIYYQFSFSKFDINEKIINSAIQQ